RFDELQCTVPVMSWVLLSLNVPVAVNCCVAPGETVGFGGLTRIELRVAEVTLSVVEPFTPPWVALMLVLPVARLETTPLLLTVATLLLVEPHVTEWVTFCVLLSLYVPVAIKLRIVPGAIEGLAGVTAIDCKMAGPTLRFVEPVMLARLALIVV